MAHTNWHISHTLLIIGIYVLICYTSQDIEVKSTDQAVVQTMRETNYIFTSTDTPKTSSIQLPIYPTLARSADIRKNISSTQPDRTQITTLSPTTQHVIRLNSKVRAPFNGNEFLQIRKLLEVAEQNRNTDAQKRLNMILRKLENAKIKTRELKKQQQTYTANLKLNAKYKQTVGLTNILTETYKKTENQRTEQLKKFHHRSDRISTLLTVGINS